MYVQGRARETDETAQTEMPEQPQNQPQDDPEGPFDPSPQTTQLGSGATQLIRRQRIFLVITTSAAVLALAGLAASTLVESPAQHAADSQAPPASVLTAPVVSRVLAQTVVVRGTVSAQSALTVTPTAEQGAQSLVVTGLPTAAGASVRAGEVLVQVSGRPLIALPGATPVYRDLKPGDSGADVAELQKALGSLGYPSSDQSGYFGPGTKSAVAALYAHLGYDPPTTGGDGDAGDQQALQAAAQAVIGAQRSVAADTDTLAAATSGHATASAGPARLALQYAQQDLATAQKAQAQLIATTGVEMPMNELVFVPQLPATLVAVNGQVGAAVSAPLVTLDTGKPVVDAVVQQTDSAMLKAGMKVQITAESLNQQADGVLSYLGPYSSGGSASGGSASGASGSASSVVASGSSGGGGQQGNAPGYPLTVTPNTTLPDGWLGQNVRLTITSATTPGPVLVVPVAAITTGSDGTTSVVTRAANGTQTTVQVQAGADADGYVQVTPVTPGALKAGQLVVTGQ